MQKNIEKTKSGWPIPVNVRDNFSEYCSKVGSITQDDCAGALFVWQFLPPNLREWARLEAKNMPVKDKEFWNSLEKYIDEVLCYITVSSLPQPESSCLEGLGRRILADVEQKPQKKCRENPITG